MRKKHNQHSQVGGFTLIEVLVVVVIISIVAAIAFPSYLAYTRKATASLTEQEILKLAEQLERHKSRNFTYRAFDATSIYGTTGVTPATVNIPVGATGTAVKYVITIRDLNAPTLALSANGARGRGYAIRAATADAQSFNYLLTSGGVRCKNKSATLVTFVGCGIDANGAQEW